jgi:hypothetical protein
VQQGRGVAYCSADSYTPKGAALLLVVPAEGGTKCEQSLCLCSADAQVGPSVNTPCASMCATHSGYAACVARCQELPWDMWLAPVPCRC